MFPKRVYSLFTPGNHIWITIAFNFSTLRGFPCISIRLNRFFRTKNAAIWGMFKGLHRLTLMAHRRKPCAVTFAA